MDPLVESIQAYLDQIPLSSAVPEDVQKQFEVVKKLCLHAHAACEFWTVSSLIAFLAVESALKYRFAQYYSGHFVLEKSGQTETLEATNYDHLRPLCRKGWKLADWPKFRPTLYWLVEWAASKGLLGELEEMARETIPQLRNSLAHPDFQQIVPPGMALTAVLRCGQIINQLFASAAKPD